MTKSRDEANAAVIKRLRARLERKSRGATAEADAQLRAQVDFFARLRTVLFVNVDSLGTTALDDTALAVLANDASLPSGIRCPAVLLPDPSGMDIEPAPKHDLFALPEVPTAAGKRSASQSADDKRTPVIKKQRTFARPHQYSLDLPATCPPPTSNATSRSSSRRPRRRERPRRVTRISGSGSGPGTTRTSSRIFTSCTGATTCATVTPFSTARCTRPRQLGRSPP
ncbi:hypothetical protein PF010_g19300 [Phytophthora fragariae]|uniref:Uncharacterized protein n=1 Tax=Phytophthora fragariae TaxID=53985 RepID=A0A6G0KHL2_9STRA|nr:hypothetical protein PF010_g19300 [Phytophthora fragariae]